MIDIGGLGLKLFMAFALIMRRQPGMILELIKLLITMPE